MKKVIIVVAAIAVFVIIGVAFSNKDKGQQQPQTNTEKTSVETSIETTVDDYMDALRKCTVTEAADIYNTGIGGDRNHAFDDAKETCQKWYKDWGEKDFIETSNINWEDRKGEVIEGKTLQEYLDALNW